jgi:hypothetical protein
MDRAVAFAGERYQVLESSEAQSRREAAMAYVVVVAGPHRWEVKPLTARSVPIGRGVTHADGINLGHDSLVSRPQDTAGRPGHAILEQRDGDWYLEDCGSTHMTWVIHWNKFNPLAKGAFVRVKPAFLFACGSSQLLFLSLSEPPALTLLKDLCGPKSTQDFHPLGHDGNTEDLGGTETNPVPKGDESAALLRWEHIVKVLHKHGLGDLAQ